MTLPFELHSISLGVHDEAAVGSHHSNKAWVTWLAYSQGSPLFWQLKHFGRLPSQRCFFFRQVKHAFPNPNRRSFGSFLLLSDMACDVISEMPRIENGGDFLYTTIPESGHTLGWL